MKKLFSFLLALTLLLCTACGTATDDNQDETTETTNIYTEITGIDPDATVMTVGNFEIPADLYFYWLTTVAKNMESQIQMYHLYYGQYGSLLNEDKTLKWDAPYSQTVTVGEMIRVQAEATVAFFAIVENMASANNITLTDAQRAEIDEAIAKNVNSFRESLVAQDSANEALTEEELLAKYYYALGVDEETLLRLHTIRYLRDGLVALMMDESSNLYVTDEAYNDFAFYADHILIATVDLASRAPLTSDKIAEKRALAESLLEQLQTSEVPETLFNALADKHSEDTGRQSNPTGYIYTEGTMVTEFESAVKALKPGEISGIVESTYGYHIILRRDLAEGLEQYPEQRTALTEYYMDLMVDMIISNSVISTGESMSGINLGEVFHSYMQKSGQRTESTSGVTATDK